MGVVGDQWVIGGQRVGEKYGAVERVGWGRIDGVGGEGDDHEDKRVEPCVSKGEGFPSSEETLCFSAFREWSGGFCLRVSLQRKRWSSQFSRVKSSTS